jgi:hypothetical protein
MKSNWLLLTENPATVNYERDIIRSPFCAISEHVGIHNFISELIFAFVALSSVTNITLPI